MCKGQIRQCDGRGREGSSSLNANKTRTGKEQREDSSFRSHERVSEGPLMCRAAIPVLGSCEVRGRHREQSSPEN